MIKDLLKNPKIVLPLVAGVAFVFLRYTPIEISSPFLLTLGRFHPVLLHFPLVLVAILLAVEMLRIFQILQTDARLTYYLLVTTLLFTAFTFITGYLLYTNGEYTGLLMDEHFNGALGTSILLILSFLLFVFREKKSWIPPLFTGTLVLTNAVALYTGHQGGSLTHGRNFLTEYIAMMENPEAVEELRNDSLVFLYEDMIEPILESRCAGCHNSLRAKGGISVSSLTALYQKGESGKRAVVHSLADSSELYRRLILPDTLDEHMPPAGKTPLDRKEIQLIKYWINAGASAEMSLSELPDSVTNMLVIPLSTAIKKYRFDLVRSQLNRKKTTEELIALASDIEMIIKSDSLAEGDLYMLSNKFPPVTFTGKKLLELKPYFELFSKVSVASSEIDDADLYFFANMTNLQELYLQKTKVQGQGLLYLSKLPRLEKLNLSFTGTDDKLLLELLRFPALKEVYLYGTKVSYPVIQAVQAYKPELKIYTEEGPYF